MSMLDFMSPQDRMSLIKGYCEDVIRLCDLSKMNNISIDSVEGFPVKTRNILKSQNINTLGDLSLLSKRDLIKIPNMRNKCIDDIERALFGYKLSLKKDGQDDSKGSA